MLFRLCYLRYLLFKSGVSLRILDVEQEAMEATGDASPSLPSLLHPVQISHFF